MKKFILIILTTLTLSSCDANFITTVDINDGQFIILRDKMKLTKIGDTLVIEKTNTNISLYGESVLNLPRNTSTSKFINGKSYIFNTTYSKVVRIK
jgi:hypothetical protein